MHGKKCVAEEQYQRYDLGPLPYCPQQCKSGRSDEACLISNYDSSHEYPTRGNWFRGKSAIDYLTIAAPFPEQDEKMRMLEFTKQGGGPVATALVTLSVLVFLRVM